MREVHIKHINEGEHVGGLQPPHAADSDCNHGFIHAMVTRIHPVPGTATHHHSQSPFWRGLANRSHFADCT